MYDWLDGWLRALPGAEHGYKEEWNWHRYTVRGRHFAALCTPDSKYKVYGGHPLVNLKCDPRLAEGLREQYPEILPGFYCDKRTWIAVLLDGELTVGYSGSVLSASQIIRAKNDGFYLLTDSTVERFNSVGEFQWSQPLSARPRALIEGKQIMVLSGNTVQVVTPPEQTASSGQ